MDNQRWSRFGNRLADLVMPAQCVSCGAWESWLCPVCAGQVGDQVLYRKIAVDGVSGLTLDVASMIPYRGVGEHVILAQKQRGVRSLARLMATWLVGVLTTIAPETGPMCLVPVPATDSSRRKRGRDPWLEVCLTAASMFGPGSEVAQILEWRTRARPQKELSRKERADNVGHAMVLRPKHATDVLLTRDPAPALVLVDDVVTTGATLSECARVFFAAGMVCSQAATVCAVTSD